MLSFYHRSLNTNFKGPRLTAGLDPKIRRRLLRTRGVCIDKDGLLRKTETALSSVVKEVLQDLEIQLTETQLRQIVGLHFLSSKPILAKLLENEGIVDEFIRLVVERWDEVTKTNTFPMVEMGHALISYLKERGLKIAMVTSSSRKNALNFLRDNHIAPLFNGLISRDDINSPKPHREPYTKGKNYLRTKRFTFAIEDSRPGVESALAAGMVVFLVPTFDYTNDFETLKKVYGKKLLNRKDVIVLPDLMAVYFFLHELFDG